MFPAVPGANGSSCDPNCINCISCTGITRIQNAGSLSYTDVITYFTAAASGATIVNDSIDLSALTNGDVFSVNMLFSVSIDGGITTTPALDFFDAYSTPPSAGGNALTSFSQGFVAQVSESGRCDAVLALMIEEFGSK